MFKAMRKIVELIFGKEAANDPDIVNLYTEVHGEVINELKELILTQKNYIALLAEEEKHHLTSGSHHKPSEEAIKSGMAMRGNIESLTKELIS